MTMFTELYAIARTATLSMIVSADETSGKLTISIVPKPKKDMGEPALSKDLTLTATPEEFDSGFVAALTGYREKRQSLAEQADATNEVLAAAKAASAKKATEAVSKASKPVERNGAAPAQAASEDSDDDAVVGNASMPGQADASGAAQGNASGELSLFS